MQCFAYANTQACIRSQLTSDPPNELRPRIKGSALLFNTIVPLIDACDTALRATDVTSLVCPPFSLTFNLLRPANNSATRHQKVIDSYDRILGSLGFIGPSLQAVPISRCRSGLTVRRGGCYLLFAELVALHRPSARKTDSTQEWDQLRGARQVAPDQPLREFNRSSAIVAVPQSAFFTAAWPQPMVADAKGISEGLWETQCGNC